MKNTKLMKKSSNFYRNYQKTSHGLCKPTVCMEVNSLMKDRSLCIVFITFLTRDSIGSTPDRIYNQPTL
uniref:Putative ovule protein n=1 Tax=Solanum chacoense TaxID=4108 RepID=A0A0V0GU33_SOLCH